MAGRPKTFSDEALSDLIGQGLTTEQIAERVHCTVRTIMRRKNRLGYATPNPRVTYRFTDADRDRLDEMIADGWPLSEIVATTGWCHRTIRRHARTRAGWDVYTVASFGAQVRHIRRHAARPEWLPW